MKNLSEVVKDAILDGLAASDPEAHFHEPDAYPGKLFIEGKFVIGDVAARVLDMLSEAFADEAKRYDGTMSGGDLMNSYRDMARILKVKR